MDEAQNLSPGSLKTVVTRAGKGTKVILMGDIGQIDNPFLNSHNNGLSDLVRRMTYDWRMGDKRGELQTNPELSLGAVIRLEHGERSALAEYMTRLYESLDAE